MTTAAYAVVDPATGAVVKEYAVATDTDIDAALATAHEAYREWSTTGLADRAAVVARIGELHAERAGALGAIISREMGKPLDQAVGEVEFSAEIYAYYARNAATFLADQPITLAAGEGEALIRRQPIGALLGVMPWNYPAYQVARFAAPNLVLGNTIVLKHAAQCPESSAAIEQILLDAGLPPGGYTNVYATKAQVARAIADPRIVGVSFTGSESAGAVIAETAGRNLKKVVLELGGSDPFIVFSTDDLEATIEAALDARFENTGQACNGAKRFIVADHLYDEFVERFTRKALARGTGLSPLSSTAAATHLQGQLDRAVAEGATLARAGRTDGAYFPPAVLTDVEPSSPSAAEEHFGPVATIYRFHSEAEAIELANSTAYGLGSYVFTTDPEQADRVADRIEAGMVFVNGVGLDAAELPFGGIKRSGFGRELGSLGIEEFANRKLIRTVSR